MSRLPKTHQVTPLSCSECLPTWVTLSFTQILLHQINSVIVETNTIQA